MKYTKEQSYEQALTNYQTISGWKDADEQANACLRRVEEIKIEEESERLEKIRQAEEKRITAEKAAKMRKKVIAITAPILVVCITFAVVFVTMILPKQKLNKAIALIGSGDYEAAYALLEEIGENDTIAQSRYERAIALIGSGDYEAAYILLKGLNYQDSAERLAEMMPKYYHTVFSKAKVGSEVIFGNYEQDNNTLNGKEKIEWIVLAKGDDRILVISKYALDCRAYNTNFTPVTWENSTLRGWLNDTFLNAAFDAQEQSIILQAIVTADANATYETSAGNDTVDKIFLLSIAEANQYFSSNARKCQPTAYAKA